MLHRWLTNDELERAVYIDPTDAAARAEMLRRVPGFIDQEHETIKDLEMQLEIERKDREAELANMKEEMQQAEAHADELQKDLDRERDAAEAALQVARNERDQALRRIEALTACEDLV